MLITIVIIVLIIVVSLISLKIDKIVTRNRQLWGYQFLFTEVEPGTWNWECYGLDIKYRFMTMKDIDMRLTAPPIAKGTVEGAKEDAIEIAVNTVADQIKEEKRVQDSKFTHTLMKEELGNDS